MKMIDECTVPKLNSTKLEKKMTDQYRCGPNDLEMKMTYRCSYGPKTKLK